MDTKRFGLTSLTAIALAFGGVAYAQDGADLPPNARPGQCFSRVLAPERYEAVTEEVIVQPPMEQVEIVPAEYDWQEKEIIIEEGYETLEVVPARFSTRTETVIVEPEREEYRVVPAQYENREERVKVRDAYTTWKKGQGAITRVDSGTGEIMCLVEIPAEYRTVSRRVMTSPPRTERVVVPAKSRTIERRVVEQVATVRKVAVPAKSSTVRYQRMIAPPKERKLTIPAVKDTLTTQKLVSKATLRWEEILCETNVTPGVVSNLQTALQREGLYNGAIDGRLGAETMAAIDAYQRKNALSTGGLTLETLRKLRISTATTL
jgi:hypothetical protein